MFQGDELPDVFRLFRDVHVNFTIFSMMPYDTADRRIRNYDNGFNLTLAQDAMVLLDKVTKTINLNKSVEDVRKSLQSAIKRVRLCICDLELFIYASYQVVCVTNMFIRTFQYIMSKC